jgi:hypothetical protein
MTGEGTGAAVCEVPFIERTFRRRSGLIHDVNQQVCLSADMPYIVLLGIFVKRNF